MADLETIAVEVVHARPDRQWLIALRLPAGTTAAAAVRTSGLLEHYPELIGLPPLAVFGRIVEPSTALRDGDRVELLRPLQTDPKERRRERVLAARVRRRR